MIRETRGAGAGGACVGFSHFVSLKRLHGALAWPPAFPANSYGADMPADGNGKRRSAFTD